jgi:hypothetical protein
MTLQIHIHMLLGISKNTSVRSMPKLSHASLFVPSLGSEIAHPDYMSRCYPTDPNTEMELNRHDKDMNNPIKSSSEPFN